MADEILRVAAAEDKGVKLDIKQPDILDELLALVDLVGVRGPDLWFNGRVDVLGEDGFGSTSPEWHYFGRGAGRGGRYHRYHLDPAPPAADVA